MPVNICTCMYIHVTRPLQMFRLAIIAFMWYIELLRKVTLPNHDDELINSIYSK